MSFTLLVSIVICLSAFGIALYLVWLSRDWRVAFLAVLTAGVTFEQVTRLPNDLFVSPIFFPGPRNDFSALIIGSSVWLTVFFLDRIIRERKRTEQALKTAQSNLLDAIESTSEGFALYDADDRLVMANSRHRRTLDPDNQYHVEPGMQFETIIRNAAEGDLIHSAKGRVDDWVAERLARHRDPDEPHEHQRSDGRWIRVSERKTKLGGTVVIYSDITEIKRAEETAAEAKARLMDAIEGFSEGFVLYDSHDRLILYKKRFKEIWGYADDDVRPGVAWDDLIRLDAERGTVDDVNRAQRAGRQHILEWRKERRGSVEVRFRDGRWMTIRDTASVIASH